MVIDPFVDVRVIIESLQKTLSLRKFIDRYMMNNIRSRTRKKKLELEYANIDINSKYFETTNITTYQDAAYTHYNGKLIRL